MNAFGDPYTIARLPRTYDPELLLRDLQALRDIPRAAQPGPYHKGEWTGVALYSQGGKQNAMPPGPGVEPYQPTELLRRGPYFEKILEELECPKQVVRLLTLPPGGVIGEHFDFDTNFQYGLVRLHIPIVTDPRVEFIVAGQRCTWNVGELWFADFSKPHQVRNDSDITRVHLVMDLEINDFLLALFPPELVDREKAKGIAANRGTLRMNETELSRYRCRFDVPGSAMPALVLGKSLASIARGATGRLGILNGDLVCFLNEEPAFAVDPISERSLAIRGLPQGCTLEFDLVGGLPGALELVLRGVPEDLFAARLGYMTGPSLPERVIPLPLKP
jgi:quercetin dioxygenase-like cupin family protein